MPEPQSLGPYRYMLNDQVDLTNMSEIWSASHTSADKAITADNVIIKIARMSDELYSLANQRAIQNEEKWLRSLHHPNIIRLRSIEEERPGPRSIYTARSTTKQGDPWFIVTDLLPGGDLRARLRKGPLTTALALQIIECVANALVYIHGRGCVHCDIKPENILFRTEPSGSQLTKETEPVLIDFGIAKNTKDGEQLVSGTPRWLAPEAEQAMRRGHKKAADPSWDIYALGLVLFNLISGQRPDYGVPTRQAWQRFTPEQLQHDTTVPAKGRAAMAAGLNALIEQATADNPQARLTAAQMHAEVQKLLKLTRLPAPPVRKWSRLFLTGSATALCSVVLFLWLSLSRNPEGPGVVPTAESTTNIPAAVITTTVTATTSDGSIAPTAIVTATAVPTMTPSQTPASAATSTPITNTPVPTNAQTTVTATPTTGTSTRLPATLTATPTVASPTATPAPSRTPTPTVDVPTRANTPPATPPAERRVTLLTPEEGASTQSSVTFSWLADFTLADDECFEVIFWEPEQGWRQGFGIQGAGRETSTRQTIDEQLATAINRRLGRNALRSGTVYNWGVALVRCAPYERIALLSESRTFRYTGPSSSSNSGSDVSSPRP